MSSQDYLTCKVRILGQGRGIAAAAAVTSAMAVLVKAGQGISIRWFRLAIIPPALATGRQGAKLYFRMKAPYNTVDPQKHHG
jgi:hypothetical protein